MPPLPADVAAHGVQRRRVIGSLAVTLAAVWQGVNVNDPDGYYRRVLPPVNAAMAAQASLASAWLARKTGSLVAAPRLPYERVRGGVPQRVVYGRPLLEIGRQIAAGRDYDAARRAAGNRLSVIARTDVQTAYTLRSHDLLNRDGMPDGYRRAVGGRPCPLCVAAADTVYRSADVMPRHGGCTCGIVPIVDGDPGPLVDDAAGVDRVDVRVEEHGETGATLVDARHVFTELGAA